MATVLFYANPVLWLSVLLAPLHGFVTISTNSTQQDESTSTEQPSTEYFPRGAALAVIIGVFIVITGFIIHFRCLRQRSRAPSVSSTSMARHNNSVQLAVSIQRVTPGHISTVCSVYCDGPPAYTASHHKKNTVPQPAVSSTSLKDAPQPDTEPPPYSEAIKMLPLASSEKPRGSPSHRSVSASSWADSPVHDESTTSVCGDCGPVRSSHPASNDDEHGAPDSHPPT